MHYALPHPDRSPGMGNYRHLVDYMGHEHLGRKTLLFLVDGIWAGKSWQGYIEKWEMEPFNDDFPSSLFLSQDPVAIESVCYDFLLAEYEDRSSDRYPYMDGTDDYIYQAASSDYWPSGIQYDPENDGTVIGSLGVFEHWNDATRKQYTNNLGLSGGIELVSIPEGLVSTETGTGPDPILINDLISIISFTNPATEIATIEYSTNSQINISIEVFTITGKKITTLIKNENKTAGIYQTHWNVSNIASGMYVVNININNKNICKSIKITVK